MTTLVLDVETVANDRLPEYVAKFEPRPPAPEPEPEEEAPKKKKKKAAKKIAEKKGKADKPGLSFLTGKIACICVKPLGKPAQAFADEDEEAILGAFHEYLIEHRPISLVTYNGRSFDVPFLQMRGLLHGYDLSPHLPNDRFAKNHIDIYADILGGKWSSQNGKLAELAWYFSVDSIDGSGADVQKQYDAGEWDAIIAHCIGDVEATEALLYKLQPYRRV